MCLPSWGSAASDSQQLVWDHRQGLLLGGAHTTFGSPNQAEEAWGLWGMVQRSLVVGEGAGVGVRGSDPESAAHEKCEFG